MNEYQPGRMKREMRELADEARSDAQTFLRLRARQNGCTRDQAARCPAVRDLCKRSFTTRNGAGVRASAKRSKEMKE